MSYAQDDSLRNGALDLRDERVLAQWAAELKVSEDDLLAAASIVGPMPGALRYYIESKQRGGRPLKILTSAERAQFEARKQLRDATRSPRTPPLRRRK